MKNDPPHRRRWCRFYILVLGSTGEAVALSSEEIRLVLDFVVEVNDGRVPLMAGAFGDMNTNLIIDKLNQLNLSGYQAILVSSPTYVKPTQEGIIQFYNHLYAEGNPVGIKGLLEIMGLIANRNVRTPLVNCSDRLLFQLATKKNSLPDILSSRLQ